VTLTQLFFLGKLQTYCATLVDGPWTAQLTQVRIWDVITVHAHAVNMLPYATTTVDIQLK